MHFILDTITTPGLSNGVGLGLAVALLVLIPLLKMNAPTPPRSGQTGN